MPWYIKSQWQYENIKYSQFQDCLAEKRKKETFLLIKFTATWILTHRTSVHQRKFSALIFWQKA